MFTITLFIQGCSKSEQPYNSMYSHDKEIVIHTKVEYSAHEKGPLHMTVKSIGWKMGQEKRSHGTCACMSAV